MCSIKRPRRNNNAAFTLLELLLVIALIGLLASLLYPTFDKMRERSENVVCTNNLKQIGVAIMQKVQENGNVVPKIESDPSNPTYAPGDDAKPLLEVLRPYGVTEKVLRCPSDVRHKNYFAKAGSSYEWYSFVDGENVNGAKIYIPAGILNVPLSLVQVTGDFESVHNKKKNYLFGDGHVGVIE